MKQRTFLLSIAVLVAALVAFACGSDSDDPPAPTPTVLSAVVIEQSDGEQLTLEQPPERIVSLGTSATEILCAIGAGDQLVAVDSYANCPLGSSELPELDSFSPNLEAIAGFEPDLVYMSDDRDGALEALRNIGITVLYLELPTSLDGVLDRIVIFGRVTGQEDEAEVLVQAMRERMQAVIEAVEDVEEGPRVFHELDPTYFTVSPDSFVGDFYNLLKAQNIAAGAQGEYPQLSAEVIIERDPEVIVLADEAAGVTEDSIASRPGWDTLTAVQTGRVCLVDPDIVSRPGPRIVEALEALGACLYPELFS
jgi:iron complex transport system substrate-binding protein